MENNKRLVIGILAGIIIISSAIMSGSMFEYVDSSEIVCIQDPVDGEMHWYIGGTASGGMVQQNFGTPTHYKKSWQFWFVKEGDVDESIKVLFNDGGRAQMSGSLRITMPLDEKSLSKIHTTFGSQEAIEHALVRTTIEKSIYMSGPLMSSTESYAAKRNQLLTFVEDQASGGIYKTIVEEKKTKDELSGAEKTVSVVSPVIDGGHIKRETASPLKEFSLAISPGSLSIKSIDYAPEVEAQIKQQQDATMRVQTAMANAKKAEQDAITAAKTGEANAATAKWKQEVIKAQMVTEAEQNLAVQRLATEQAKLYKDQQILEGQGEAEKKKLIMSADGALDKKLASIEVISKYWADAYAKRQVPTWYQAGGSGGGADNEFQNFMNMSNIANASKIGLDLTIPKK
jgi:regulator of protease activity HflC (stomatin/prohibitin superfamily)